MTQNETSPDAPARQRIAKLMARVGLCSRRDAEAWIVEGRVSLNGNVLTSPATDAGPEDLILVDGAPLPAAEKTRLFLFHKPRGFISTDSDPEGRATVAEYLRDHWPDGPRVVTIGRLDFNTEGLLLLTNDGGLARLLELPKTGWVRRYRVRAKGETDQGVLDRLRDGITIEGVDYAGIEAALDRTQGANVWLTMGLREGKNREVKRVLEHIGLEVNRLIRLSFGPFQLGDLPEGAVEEVRTRVLRDQLGTALAAAAGVSFEDAPPPAQPKHARGPAKGRAEAPMRGAARPARDDARREPRGGERPLRRGRETRGTPETAPAPIRERPTAGTRKHVSALRAAEAETARHGPRRRIERSDVTDRKDRTVSVERLVGARPAPLAPTRGRHGKPDRRDTRGPDSGRDGTRQASPSALAKRARIAKSGADEARLEQRRDDTPRRDQAYERPVRERPARRPGDDERRMAPRDGATRRDEAGRTDAGEGRRPQRTGLPRRPSDGEPREARGEGAPKRFGAKRADGTRRPHSPGTTRRPGDAGSREAQGDGAPKRSAAKRAAGNETRRPHSPGATRRPSDGGSREALGDGAPKRLAAKRAAGNETRRPHSPGAARRPSDGGSREARSDGAPKRFDAKRADTGGTRRPPRETRDATRLDESRPGPGGRREARGGRRSDGGEARAARPARAAAAGKPRSAAGPRKPGGGKPPRGPARGKPSPRPKR